MKVSELIAHLQKLPQDAVAVVAKDAEGNGFDTVSQATVGVYSVQDGEFSDIENQVEGVQAVCIWP